MRVKSKSRRRLDRGRRLPSIYSRTEEVATPRRNGNIYWIFLIFVFVVLTFLVFYLPYFQIKSITINDTKFLERDLVKNEVVKYKDANIFNKNILTFSAAGLNRNMEKIGGVDSIKVNKIFPDRLSLTVLEKKPIFVWETLGKKYLVDEKGRVSGDYEEKFNTLPNVYDSKNVPLSDSKQLVSAQFSNFINDLHQNFPNYSEAKITKIEVPEITSEIKVQTDASWYAYFDTTRTAKGQLVNLSRIVTEAKSKKKRLEYVDLRIDNRIFYK